MKRLFTALQGKLAGAPIMTKLNALQFALQLRSGIK